MDADELMAMLSEHVVASDAVPKGTVLFLPPRRTVQVTDARTGQTVRRDEPLEEYAHRCVAVKDVTLP